MDVGLGDKPPVGEVAVHELELSVQGRRTDAGLPQGDGTGVAQPSSCFQTAASRVTFKRRGEPLRCVWKS